MRTVDDAIITIMPMGVPSPRRVSAVPRRARPSPAACAARPGSPLAHPDGRCECFFGGPPPEFVTLVAGGLLR